ncbi:helix-turn-helix domain-containing protein [Kitasatospora mediocidica]|uniref:helix-turn-helix domain-containing protein n=1 Tax=Kitasatospora mediocidica TaxID=58352 RepID=UPI000690CB2A|nr:Scr1 family TA system antitoxin-like transcriptional regulator [Kitasatospora mediocidica]
MFAAELANAREEAGMSQPQLGRLVSFTSSQICRVEGGSRKPSLEFAQACDRALGTGRLLERMWRRTDWHGILQHPDWFREYAGLEAEAVRIRMFQLQVVPGLLQTADYARTLFRAGQPQATSEEIESHIRARLARQQILGGENPVHFCAVLDEGVLVRTYGGHTVMRGQLAHLLNAAQLPNVTIRVAPFTVDARAAFDQSFTLLTRAEEADAIYIEGVRHGQLVDDPAEYAHWSRLYDLLLSEALPEAASLERIRTAMEGLHPMTVPTFDPATAPWRKSTYSNGQQAGNCIEIADSLAGIVPVRDSKDPSGPALAFSAEAFASFVAGIKRGDFGDV